MLGTSSGDVEPPGRWSRVGCLPGNSEKHAAALSHQPNELADRLDVMEITMLTIRNLLSYNNL